jgi:hypothetical protein
MTKKSKTARRERWDKGLEAVEFPANFQDVIKAAFKDYSGDLRVFAAAVGALHMGFMLGWRPLMIVHNPKTFRKYEQILKINFREVMPETTDLSDRNYGYRAVQIANNYWDVVRGTAPVERRHEMGLDDLPL